MIIMIIMIIVIIIIIMLIIIVVVIIIKRIIGDGYVSEFRMSYSADGNRAGQREGFSKG